MSRPCAYCKETGHHIRDCLELAEKNRRQAMKSGAPRPQCVEQKKPLAVFNRPKNTFANLYSSSDDETEEGEIVESDQERSSFYPSPLSSSPSLSSLSDGGWTRSGIKSVHIQTPFNNNISDETDDEDYPEYIHEPSAAWIKYRGWSWVDIEYDSE